MISIRKRIKDNLFFLVMLFFLFYSGGLISNKDIIASRYDFDEQDASILAIKKNINAVVNIIVNEEVINKIIINRKVNDKIFKEEKLEREVKNLGSGTGFLISSNGYILTNKHLVFKENTDNKIFYKIVFSDGSIKEAEFIDSDPINDLAVLKVDGENLTYVELGNSDELEQGSSVIAIGNALGRYQNTVTKGIVSGLFRTLVAKNKNSNQREVLTNVLQVDAEINVGNSGGPLINLSGEVVGINAAIDQSGTSIGFAIPINDAKQSIDSVLEYGEIIRPKLGIHFVMIDPQMFLEKKLSRDSGALIVVGSKDKKAVLKDTPAFKAGLKDGDIIFKINNIEINEKNNLSSVIQRFKPGDEIVLRIQRGNDILTKYVILDKF